MEDILKEKNITDENAENMVKSIEEKSEAEKEMPKKSTKRTPKETVLISAIVMSCIIVVTGVLTFSGVFGNGRRYGSASTVKTSYEFYGGDAYTGMQQASADASNNAAAAAYNAGTIGYYLADMMNMNARLFGLVIIGLGMISGCYFGVKYAECISDKEKENKRV